MKLKEVIVGAGVAIIDRKQLLIIKRAASEKHFPEHWACPAGKVKPEIDRTLEDTAIREAKEEIGLRLSRPLQKLNFYESFLENKWFIVHIFLAFSWEGTIKIEEDEISEFRWVTYRQAVEELKFAFAYREVIEDLYRRGWL